MKLQLQDLPLLQPINKVVIHSLEQMTYQISVAEGDKETILYFQDKPFSSHSLCEIKEMMEPLDVDQYVLRHAGVYEEMIGLPDTNVDTTLEIPLTWSHRGH